MSDAVNDIGNPPVLRVVRGSPTDEELAALTAVVLAMATHAARSAANASAERSAAGRSAWSDRSALTRRMPHPGPGAWRASALPR